MFCYQKNFTNPTLPVDEQQFYALVRAAKWNEDIDRYRETGEASLKRKLPAFIFQATFDETTSKTGKIGRWRKQAATRLTGLVVMDIDHIEDPRKVCEGWGIYSKEYRNQGLAAGAAVVAGDNQIPKIPDSLDNKKSLERILLVYVTPSGKGLKVVFKADPQKGNLIDNQHAMAKVLGVEVDESCKDASRMSFICKESDILFIDKELFTYENREFAEKYNEQYRGGHTQPTLRDTGSAVAGGRSSEYSKDNHSKEYRNQGIIDTGVDKEIPKFQDSLEKK